MTFMDGFHLASRSHQHSLNRGLADAIHGIQCHAQSRFTDSFHIYCGNDAVQVLIQRIDFFDQSGFQFFLIIHFIHRQIRHLIDKLLDLHGLFLVCISAAVGEYLNTIVDCRIMARRDHHTVLVVMLHHIEHYQRCRYGFIDQFCMYPFCREYHCSPLHGFLGQETSVITDDHSGILHTFLFHLIAQCLGQDLDILLRKIFSDDGSETTGTKFDHNAASLYIICFLLLFRATHYHFSAPVPRSFTHLCASSCGLRPFDPGIIYIMTNTSCSVPARNTGTLSALCPSTRISFIPCITLLRFSTLIL